MAARNLETLFAWALSISTPQNTIEWKNATAHVLAQIAYEEWERMEKE